MKTLKLLTAFSLIALSFGIASSWASDPKPKYGPEITLLSASHEYVLKNAAPDYWALSPYYVEQEDEASCSISSTAMVVNGARVGWKMTADDELATQKGLMKRATLPPWKDGKGGPANLDELGALILDGLKAYGVKNATAEVVHTDDMSDATKKKLHHALVENEKSANDFIVINFIQGVYTGDADAGHISPIAAYDAKKKRVLVLDPDRQWYEPYWVSEETLLKGMATEDKSSGKHRGFVWVKLSAQK